MPPEEWGLRAGTSLTPGLCHIIFISESLTALIHFLRQLLLDDRWLTSRRCVLVTIWIVLATLTHIPVPKSIPQIGGIDKVFHVVAYFPLGLLLPVCRVRGCHRWLTCLLLIAGYGVLDELFQIPAGRTASVWDWIADVVGASAGIVALRRFVPADPAP